VSSFLLYAGGVVVLVVFAIMLTERIVDQRIPQASHGLINGAIVTTAGVRRDRGVPLAGGTDAHRETERRRYDSRPRPRLPAARTRCRWSSSACSSSSHSWARSTSRARTEMPAASAYLVVAALVFAIGLFGVLTRRNAVGFCSGSS